MSLSFVSQAIVLVTSAVNTDGSVNLSQLNGSNTVQIPVIKDSLNISYQEDYEYIPLNNSIDFPVYLEGYSNTVLSVQDIRFSTYLSSNKFTAKPVDYILWESLARQVSTPGTNSSEIGIFSGPKLARFLGVIVIFSNTCYVYSGAVASQASLSLDMSGIPSVGWTVKATNMTQMEPPTVVDGMLSGSITGSFSTYTIQDYNLTASKFLKVTVTQGLNSYQLASRNCTLTLDNSYEYMNSGSSMTTYNTQPIFAGYTKSSCTGQFSFYLKGTASSFFEQSVFANKNQQIKQNYGILIEAPLPSGSNLFTIDLKQTMLEPALNLSQVIEGSCQFRAVNGDNTSNSAIKFYN